MKTTHGVASLFLRITIGKRATLYCAVPMKPDPRVATRAWRLFRPGRKKKKEWYDVGICPNGWITCTCPDAVYRDKVCKHGMALRALGLLATCEA